MPAVSTRESSHARIGDVREASVGALADVVDVASLRCDRFVEGEVLRNAVRSEIDAYQLGRAGNDERLRRGAPGSMIHNFPRETPSVAPLKCSKRPAPFKRTGLRTGCGDAQPLNMTRRRFFAAYFTKDNLSMPGKRPKLVLYPTRTVTQPAPARTDDDFAIYTSYRINAGHLYHGSLKVVRKTDGRLLFPFDGALSSVPLLRSMKRLRRHRNVGARSCSLTSRVPKVSKSDIDGGLYKRGDR
jgi:hypothetical protein